MASYLLTVHLHAKITVDVMLQRTRTVCVKFNSIREFVHGGFHSEWSKAAFACSGTTELLPAVLSTGVCTTEPWIEPARLKQNCHYCVKGYSRNCASGIWETLSRSILEYGPRLLLLYPLLRVYRSEASEIVTI
jgi:hypothetical protein